MNGEEGAPKSNQHRHRRAIGSANTSKRQANHNRVQSAPKSRSLQQRDSVTPTTIPTIQDLMKTEDLGEAYIAYTSTRIDALDRARREVVEDSKKVHLKIRKMCDMNKSSGLLGRIAVPNKNRGQRKRRNKSYEPSILKVPANKTEIIAEVSSLPQDFFVQSMMDSIMDKWKQKKNTVGNIEKLFTVEQRFKKVQQSIDDALFNYGRLEEAQKLDEDQKERFNNMRAQADVAPVSKQILKSQPIITVRQRQKSIKFLRLPSKILNDSMQELPGESEQTKKLRQQSQDIFNSEKAVQKLRKKIDGLYMKFAGTPMYQALYEKSKLELEQTDENFHYLTKKPRYYTELTDFFVTGEELESVPLNILTVPLINTHLATNKKAYYKRSGDKSSVDTVEAELISRVVEERVPKHLASIKPTVKRILADNLALHHDQEEAEELAGMNQNKENPLADKWKLNLFIKSKADKELQNLAFPRKKVAPEPTKYVSDRFELRNNKIRHKFIKDPDEIDKFNTTEYYYRKSITNKITKNEADSLFSKINMMAFSAPVKHEFASRTEMIKEQLRQEKKILKSKVSTLYADLNECQKDVDRFRHKIDCKEEELKKEQKANGNLFDNNLGVNKLIKDSMVETYELVKNNLRASSIKMRVCSASNYLKKTKRI